MEIDKRLMTFDTFSFREYLARPIIIFSKNAMSNFKEINEAFKKMDGYDENNMIFESGNSFLAFAYIDQYAGITFDVLGICNLEEDDIDINAPLKQRIILRKEVLADSSFIFPPEDLNLERFDKYIRDTVAFYHGKDLSSKNLNEVRKCTKIDKFRHPDFPDDILVHLVKEHDYPQGDIKNKYSFELIWLKTERIKDGFIQGTFLDKPFKNYDIEYVGNLVNVEICGNVAYVDTKIPQEAYNLIFNSNKIGECFK